MGVLGYAVLGHTVLGQPDVGPIGGTTTTNPTAGPPVRFHLGDVITLIAQVRDEDDNLAAPGAMGLLIVHESGDEDDLTSSIVTTEPGEHTVPYVPAVMGRHVATWTATGAYAGVAQVVFDVDALDLAIPTVAEVRAYLAPTTASDTAIADALAVERDDQREWCRIDPYTQALRAALFRRVAKHLAVQKVPTAQVTSFGQGATAGPALALALDAEIERLERSRRRPGIA